MTKRSKCNAWTLLSWSVALTGMMSPALRNAAAETGGLRVADLTLVIPGLKRGMYVAEIWDTVEGKPVDCRNAYSDGTVLKYNLPPVNGDVALKVRRERD